MFKSLKIKTKPLIVFVLVVVFSAAGVGWLSVNQMIVYAMFLVLLEGVFFVYFLNSIINKLIQAEQKEVERLKNDFISFSSHQLRTPLTVIKWNTEMLINDNYTKLTLEQRRYVTEIERGGKRAVNLINSLLNVSSLNADKFKIETKPTDLVALISGVISEITPFANAKNCTIKFNKPNQAPPLINVDPILFRQVITNLVSNALHFSKPNKCKVEVDFKKVDGNYQVDIVDEGIGIPLAVQNKIFNKFYRADNAVQVNTEGIGLGLYITKLILDASGGKIWFESTEGKGSVFHISIPTSGMNKEMAGKKLSV